MRQVAIVGSSASSESLAPFADESWEIWGLAWRDMPRATRLFEVHHPSVWPRYSGPGYPRRLADLGNALWMRFPTADLTLANSYPFAEVRQRFALSDRPADIFTSSIAYMLALAIAEGVDRIGIYGVDMNAEDEWAYQRPAAEFLIGVAVGAGIDVVIAPQSALCRANFVYGGAEGQPRALGITEDVMQSRIAHYENLRRDAQERMNAAVAEIQSVEGCLGESRALLELVKHFNRGGVIPGLPRKQPPST
jgi:hypothetical protein